jgi:hypothetical protein
MGEKRGNTVKIKFEFNASALLEVQFKSGDWFRVTPSQFRAYDGPRRITEPTETGLRIIHATMRTYDYEGPLYITGTNKEVAKTNNYSFR